MAFRNTLAAACAASLTLVLATDPASACGGLFCSANNPVNQAAERIIFAQNPDGTVTAAIEILYEGPGHEFAWVLPVPPGETQVGVSSKNALDRLDQRSNPVYRLNTRFEDGCGMMQNSPMDTAAVGFGGAVPASDPNGVTVVAEGNAGPYDWVQIELDPNLKDPADAAVLWLEQNGYDVTDLGPELLGEYLADGMNLIAFRLQKGKDDGSIRPILLTYESERPFIPIKPTAVAANEDMGIKVWVLGNSRAIPDNYPHLEMNEALINWFNANQNYNEVVIAAADEAGGHGFVTEQAGPAGQFADAIYSEFEEQQWEQLRTGRFESLAAFFQMTQNMFSTYDGFNDVMLDPEIIPLREGATHEQFLACINCYFETNVAVRNEAYPSTPYPGETDPIHSVDIPTFLDTFHAFVIEPLELTRALFEDNASVTRFYTTLSPDEMTKDPSFDFNAELPDVDNVHIAEQLMSCNFNEWTIKLPQGMVIHGEGTQWPISLNSEFPVNLRIVQLSTEGEGEILEDNSQDVASLLTDLDLGEAMPQLTDPSIEPGDTSSNNLDDSGESSSNDDDVEKKPTSSADAGGCSVSSVSGPSSSLAWLGLLGLPLLLRRRR